MAELGKPPAAAWVDPYSSRCPDVAALLASPRGWLLRVGCCAGRRDACRDGDTQVCREGNIAGHIEDVGCVTIE